jgi:hypothetical protein
MLNQHTTWPVWFSIKYAELVDPVQGSENAKWPSICSCCFISKFLYKLPLYLMEGVMTQPAGIATEKCQYNKLLSVILQ